MAIDEVVNCGYCSNPFQDGDIAQVVITNVAYHEYYREANVGHFPSNDASCFDRYKTENPNTYDATLGMFWCNVLAGLPPIESLNTKKGKPQQVPEGEYQKVPNSHGSNFHFLNPGAATHLTQVLGRKLPWWPILHDFKNPCS